MTPALPTGASRRFRAGLISSLTLAALALPGIALAAGEAEVLRARAASLASGGDCAGALPLVEKAKRMDPSGDGATRLMVGRCYISMEKFAEARIALDGAVAHAPESGDALLARGVASYHLGDKAAARADLEQAQQRLPNNPEAELYLGMMLLEEERPAEAIERLDRTRTLQSDTVEPAANYYAALAHAESGDSREAEAALRRVQEIAPGTIWAERAEAALAQAEARRAGARSRWLTLQAGLDYDSNVALLSGAVSRPGNISSKDDGRAWWGVDGGADLFRKNGWGGGAGASYTGSQPFTQEDFDQHFVSASFWLDRELGANTLLRVTPEGGYGWFDGDDFLRYLAIRPELRHDFGRAGRGTLFVRYAYNDFLYEEFDVALRNDRDRDGHYVLVGYDHIVAIGPSTSLRGGVFGRDNTTVGSEYDLVGGGGWLGFRQLLPLDLILDASGRVEYDKYDRRSTFDPSGSRSRRDTIGMANAVLTKPINEWLSVSARYQYLDNDSNVPVFDYHRHIVGAFVTVGLLR
jgi:tetratricopeptide (TPR) repeat protein